MHRQSLLSISGSIYCCQMTYAVRHAVLAQLRPCMCAWKCSHTSCADWNRPLPWTRCLASHLSRSTFVCRGGSLSERVRAPRSSQVSFSFSDSLADTLAFWNAPFSWNKSGKTPSAAPRGSTVYYHGTIKMLDRMSMLRLTDSYIVLWQSKE